MNTPALPKSLASALALHQAGDLAAAEAGYQAVIDNDPANADALHLLSVLRLERCMLNS